jgi:DNA repair photolyase
MSTGVEVKPREGLIPELKKYLEKHSPITEQVMLCFTCDPFPIGYNHTPTWAVLELFKKYDVPTAILTKGKFKTSCNTDILKSLNCKVGYTLSSCSPKWLEENEPRSLPYDRRLDYLRGMKEFDNIRTWASLEPVIDPVQAIDIIKDTHEFVDEYQIGKLNYKKTDIDWEKFTHDVVMYLRSIDKPFYIKKSLQKYMPEGFFEPHEIDHDYLTVKGE